MKKIAIHNVRIGFATNSSSTHSIIFLQGATDEFDKEAPGDFGWDCFTLASEDAKRRYLGTTIYENIRQQCGTIPAQAVAWALTGAPFTEHDYVDHQSLISLPFDWKEEHLDQEFIDAISKYLMQPNLVILGGNDNGDHHNLDKKGKSISLVNALSPNNNSYSRKNQGEIVARYDKLGDYWVIFNRQGGGKVRLSFKNLGNDIFPTKAFAPELVDIKITDYCTKGCAYCYQGSTKNGLHASSEYLDAVKDVLAGLKVFEVAIGGGEPTKHPQFAHIIKNFRNAGIIPNFSTRCLDWLQGPNARDIISNMGAFAFSVDTPEDVDRLYLAISSWDIAHQENNVLRSKTTIQHVVGSATLTVLKDILARATKYELPVTLLGFKMTGRGKNFAPILHERWPETIVKLNKDNLLPVLGIDTCLASAYEDVLKKLGVPKWCYHVQEGKFSCYIDAVNGVCGPSSFCNQNEMKPISIQELQSKFVEYFQSF